MKFKLIWQRLKALAKTRSRRPGKLHQVERSGSLTFESSLLIHKLPRASRLPDALQANVAEAPTDTEEALQLHGTGQSSGSGDKVLIEGVRKSSTRGPSIAADQYEDGSYSLRIEGRGAQVLVQRKNEDGAGWPPPEIVNDGSHVDARVKLGREIVEIQVVRAETNPSFWRDLKIRGDAENSGIIDRAVKSIRAAIESKATDKKIAGDRSKIILALNALETPHHSLSLTAEAFRRVYGEWASTLGFREIWIVGGSPALTHRLDGG